tara:strand:+ start:958 stop:1116 length:159 start_codon:yes stop_codon:yes gene_type:complete
MEVHADNDAITVGLGFIPHEIIDVISCGALCVSFATEIKDEPFPIIPFKITK